jgi:homoserine dehydrogenase
LKNKKHVITANKALIAKNGDFLSRIAEKNKVNLEFEAAVGGGIPILRTIKDGLSTNKIIKVIGILNGTCNYILSEMESSKDSFSNVLKRAQSLGYAESNSKYDLNGYDALAKVRILSALAFNNKISKNKCLMDGIENIELDDIDMVNKLNFKIKLLGITEIINNKLFERVHPCLIKKDTYIANINGVMNAVILDGKPVGETVLQGEGAGPGPTSSALMSDLLSILRGNIKYPFGLPDNKRKKISSYDQKLYLNSLYLRLKVKDKSGVLSSITKAFAKNKISIKNLIQTPDKKNKKAFITIITHENFEKNYESLIIDLKQNKFLLKKPIFIRIVKL